MERVRVNVEPPVGLRGYDEKALSDATAKFTGTSTPVQQHLKDEVDVNTIVRRFGITHEMPSGREGGVYGDFSGITDYEGAVAAVEKARSGFMALPADVRERFGNDPGRLVEFAHQVPEQEFLAAFVAPQVVSAPLAPVVKDPAASAGG